MYKNCKCKKKKPLMRLFFLVEVLLQRSNTVTVVAGRILRRIRQRIPIGTSAGIEIDGKGIVVDVDAGNVHVEKRLTKLRIPDVAGADHAEKCDELITVKRPRPRLFHHKPRFEPPFLFFELDKAICH